MQILPWTVAFVASMLLAATLGAWAWRSRRVRRREALPTEWALSPRPVFSADERRVYRSLREALPHHVLLSKLPLVRFCQPTEPSDVRYWFELLGNSHVSFAVCSANGRVLAAIDLDGDRNSSRRVAQIKQAALAACRVRYLRCAVDHLPTAAELQLLVPGAGADPNAPQPAPPPPSAMAPRSGPAARAPRPVLWQDTTVFQDSFFHPDEGLDDVETFAPAAPRRAVDGPAPTPSRFFGGTDAVRRRPQSTDFEPTRDAHEDDDESDGLNGAGSRTPRFFRGSRT